jgi:hypothetical protein
MFSILSVEYTFSDSIRCVSIRFVSISCVSIRFVSIRCVSIRFVKYTFRENAHREYCICFVNVSALALKRSIFRQKKRVFLRTLF